MFSATRKSAQKAACRQPTEKTTALHTLILEAGLASPKLTREGSLGGEHLWPMRNQSPAEQRHLAPAGLRIHPDYRLETLRSGVPGGRRPAYLFEVQLKPFSQKLFRGFSGVASAHGDQDTPEMGSREIDKMPDAVES